MNKKKCNINMVLYEMRNINGNFMVHFFGIVFPNMMALIFSKTIGSQVPEAVRQEVIVSIMLSMSLVIPMSIMFIGYGALYSQEVENAVPLRMHLFGFHERSLLAAKIIAHLIFMTIAFVIYAVFQMITMDIPKPAVSSIICLIISLYLIGVILLVIAHSFANIFQKFGITFGITMFVYFVLMMLTGMMGISTEQLPKVLQKVASTLPMTYISNDFAGFWEGGSYNFMPFIQSFIFLGAVAGILMMYAQYRDRRVIK
ncbi:MAG: ABC transporter permease [Lachnospiraceae bacterium]|nr:ABC transporter permease [Lachnospiraceae bacterium]